MSPNARLALIVTNSTKYRCGGYEEPKGARPARSPVAKQRSHALEI